MRRLAVFGGSFNPPHAAHQLVGLWVLETQPVDALLVVPSFRHPFEKQLAPWDDRVAMCKLAMAPLGPRAVVDELERELNDGRTLLLLEALAAREPGVSLRLVIGADILADRDKWYRWADVERLAPPIILGREGYSSPPDSFELPNISSTEIRARVARGGDIAPLVPRTVSAYIHEHGLYRSA